MVVDGEGEGGKPSVKSGAQEDGLAKYNLDDYDDDVDEQGTCRDLHRLISSTYCDCFQESVRSRISKD